MLRIHREIARDVARITAAPLVQLLAVRGAGPDVSAETLAVEGTALLNGPVRARVTEHLARDPGHAPAVTLLGDSADRVVAPCEPALGELLWLGLEPGASALHSIYLRLGAAPEGATVLRVVFSGRQRALAERGLEAVARFAAARLEAELFRQEAAGRNAMYRALQEGAGEAILVVDAGSGRVLDGNQKVLEVTGHTRVELRRLTLAKLVEHPHLDPAAFLARLSGAAVVHEDEAFLRRRRGGPIPVAVTASHIEVGGRAVLHVIARDTARERKALSELREAKETLAALHLAGAHLMVETDEAAMYGVLARELSRLGFHCGVLGPSLDGTSGLTWRFLSFPPALRAAIDRALGHPIGAVRVDPLEAPLVRRCLTERRTVHTDEPRRAVQQLLGGAGERELRRIYRLLKVRRVILSPLRREGRPVGILAVASPKARKSDPEAIDAFALQASIALEKARLFGALREERARLETEVARRTQELTRAVTELQAAHQQKDNFVANVSHELRTPLVTILGYADLLLNARLGELAPRQRSALQVVAQSGRRLKAFIDELLDLSRHALARESYAFAPVEVAQVLRQAVLALAPRFAERGLRIRARVRSGTPRAWADRDRIQQVLMNLLANAERYSPQGGAVRVAAAQTAPGRIEIAVSDQGPGIAPEHLGHIFDRLYQVRDDRAGHKGGALGIGLAIVKEIVEAHGGEVTVRSRLGHGTTFRFTLRADPLAAATAPTPAPVPGGLGPVGADEGPTSDDDGG